VTMIHQDTAQRQSFTALAIVCSGDVILDVPDPDHWLSGIAPALREADLAIGHIEVPHSYSTFEAAGDVPAPAADPAHLAALKRAGFSAMTLAGNHIADCGEAGIADTIAGLDAQGLAYCGAGANLAQARRPALLNVQGRCVGLLSYNCVGPQSAWATEQKSGCAWLPVQTVDGSAVAPARELALPTEAARDILAQDIAQARLQGATLVIVALHKGIVHTPAYIAPYERHLAHSAIDLSADIVISHHAHIVRGIEFYQGKPIYHGLGNGCVVTRALDPGQAHPARAAWAQRRKTLFGFEPDPAYPLAPFHPEAVHAFLARVLWHADGSIEAGIVPVWVDPPGRPRLATKEETMRILGYVERISQNAGLEALNLTVRDDMLVAA
jgi:poly-gamma-glutamate capsule biosynthesis protein CapA/YwtB (metallophosphatase superfamily)